MVQFASTGNPIWDQGLSPLAGLFGEAGASAKAGYYGAEAGKTIMEGQKLKEQADWRAKYAHAMGLDSTGAAGGGTGQIVPPSASMPPPGSGGPHIDPNTTPAASTNVSVGASNAGDNIGTDGRPMPPDNMANGPMHPATFQQPGGGVKYAPPAAANGSPAPVAFSLPQMVAMGALTGMDPGLIAMTGRSTVNQMRSTGRMDDHTANEFVSGMGDSTPLQSETTLRTTAMNNANTLAQTRLQGQNRLAEQDNTPVQAYDPNNPTKVISTTAGDARKRGLTFYDPTIAAERDKLVQTQPPPPPDAAPDAPPPPPVYTKAGQAPGTTPYQPDVAKRESEVITVLSPDGKIKESHPRAWLRTHPGWRALEAPQDLATTVTTGPGQQTKIDYTPSAVGGGSQPMPTSTDQANAQLLTQLVNEQDPAKRAELLRRYQEAQTGLQPKTVTGPNAQRNMEAMLDDALQNQYPPSAQAQSGWHPGLSALKVALPEDTRAFAIDQMRQLQLTDPKYQKDPAAAAAEVIQRMVKAKILDPTITREQDLFGTDARVRSYTNPRLEGSPQERRYYIPSHLGEQGTQSDLSRIVAPTPTPNATNMPRGAVAVAPNGPDGKPAPEGAIVDGPGGAKGKVVGGFVYPLAAGG